MRLELLASDCSGVPASLLRDACDLVARTVRGLPYASEILACVEEIQTERRRDDARGVDRRQPSAFGPGQAYAARNREAAEHDDLGRITKDRQLFCMNDRNERRGCRADGTVIEPWFDDALRAWTANESDLTQLADQYRQHNRALVVRGRRIVRLE